MKGIKCRFCVVSRLLVFCCSASVQRISHFVVVIPPGEFFHGLIHWEGGYQSNPYRNLVPFFWPPSWVNVTLPKFNMEPHFMKISTINCPVQRIDFQGNPELINIPIVFQIPEPEVWPWKGTVFEVQSQQWHSPRWLRIGNVKGDIVKMVILLVLTAGSQTKSKIYNVHIP